MGYYALFAPCFVCKRLFYSNPLRVPSYQDNPICESCIRLVNHKRREKGLPEWPIFEESYEPAEEGQL